MLPSPDDLSELDSVEVTEPQETQAYRKCKKPSGHVSSSQKGSIIMAFLKRNAFVVLTMAAVALGKWFSNTVIYSPTKPENGLLIYHCEDKLQPDAYLLCNITFNTIILFCPLGEIFLGVCYLSSTALCIGSSAFGILNSPFDSLLTCVYVSSRDWLGLCSTTR